MLSKSFAESRFPMLDVHAPEHSISNAREFFLHLFTITCGLLIALGLENAAEAWHHRHERDEAEVMLRQELRENLDSVTRAQPELQREMKNMDQVLAFVQQRSAGDRQPPPPGLNLTFQEGEIQDVAWRTASSTGVLSYMDFAKVEEFAGAYREQELLQTEEQKALNDYLQLASFRPKKDLDELTPQRAAETLPYVRSALGDLIGIYAVGRGTVAAYNAALK